MFYFFSEVVNLQVGATCKLAQQVANMTDGDDVLTNIAWIMRELFLVLCIGDSGENYCFGNDIKYRSDWSKNNFLLQFFSLLF